MKKKVLTAIMLLYLNNNNNFSNNNTNNVIKQKAISEIVSNIREDLEKKLHSTSIDLINKYKLKGNFSKKDILKIKYICKKLEIQEEWLYKLFYLESRGNPKAVNKSTNATGLIQIMPSTAKNLNTTTEEILKMSTFEQLDYVYKYLVKIKGDRHFNSFLDLYFAVFYPLAINKPDNYPLGQNEEVQKKIAKYNKGIDKAGNNDGIITVSDVKKWVS